MMRAYPGNLRSQLTEVTGLGESNGFPKVAALDPAEEQGLSIRQCLHLLRRHWILFAGVWALILLLFAAYSLSVKPVYRPESTLEVRPEMPLVQIDQADPSYIASLQMWANFYRTQEALLKSPGLIQQVLASAPQPTVAAYQHLADPVKAFSENLNVEKTEASYIMKVGLIDPDPEHATYLLNTLVSKYLEDANRRLRELKSSTLEVLTRETLPAIRQRFDEAEKALQTFQNETGYADFDTEYASRVEALRKVSTRLLEVRLRGFKVSSDIDALGSYVSEGVAGFFHESFHVTRALELLWARRVALASDLARQTGILKEKHPRRIEIKNELAMVDTEIRDTVEGTLRSFDRTLESIREEEQRLIGEAERLEGDMGQSRRHLTEYKKLDSELITAKELYNAYLRKQAETRATTAAGQAGVRVVDPATVPVEPYRKSRWFAGLGAVLGFLLAAGAVVLAEQVDDRLASPREVELFLGLDVLGEIPRLEGDPPDGNLTLLLTEDEIDSPHFEAYRSLRANILTRLEEVPRGKVILVASAEEGEGKSTVAANLARVLAMEDQRVLLFDAELRWPRLKALLANPRGRGLEEFLRGEVSLGQAAQPSRIPGVDVLGADAGLLRAPELAGSMKFQAALRAAREQYAFVVIDSAPVNLVSETALIARRTDATLLVVRQGQTGRGDARAARKRLLDMRAPLMGCVVTGTAIPTRRYGYRNRRDPEREAEIIEKSGDNLVGVL
jgi:succinoglycan biosynthesis transport protein ExoP